MGRKEQAAQLLKDSSWFQDASDSLVDALASKMELVEAEDGHLFVEEGKFITHILVIEEGTLVRTKLSVDKQDLEKARDSFRKTHVSRRSSIIQEDCIKVDEVKGRGRITGLLHNVHEDTQAYATITSVGKAKVWLLHGEDFREIVSSKPEHSLDMMQAMARVLRTGSKSLASLVRKAHKAGITDEDGNGSQVLKVLCYDTASWVSNGFKPAVDKFNSQNDSFRIEMDFTAERLSEKSATYAAGYDVVCLFVNDNADANIIQTLSLVGAKMIAMRCAGFDRVDTKAARAYGLTVCRVPAYSPYAVAEHAVALLMAVNRKIAKASNRVRMANFTLDDGLMGMDIHGKTVGVMGTGKIGQILCNIVLGFGANLICYDVFENDAIKKMGGKYVSKEEIFAQSDVLFLMMPLLEATHHTINEDTLLKLKKGVVLINTSRGGLVDTKALLKGVRSGIISGVGMDVYENEQEYFFQDWSARNIQDPDLVALLGSANVVLTAHQAFFTKEAVDKIVSTTIDNINAFQQGKTGQEHPNNCIPAVKN